MRSIRLRRIGRDGEDKAWESSVRLRIGRLETLEISVDDTSVSRQHAEVYATSRGWRVRDLKSTNGTFLNGSRLASADWPLRTHDIIKCGNITFVVEELKNGRGLEPTDNPEQLVVEATAACTWEDAFEGLAYDRNRCPRPGEQLLALLRAGHHLGHLDDQEELLHSILNDAVSALDAQRGAIVLAEGPEDELHLRALATGRGEVPSRPAYSHSLAQRSFSRSESVLCHRVDEDPELAMAQSIAEGAMASVLCVLLRTPRRRIGVLHLDRGPLQAPFTKEDLHLADALAANVSAGIESAFLLQKREDLFLSLITFLAQAVELRDDYTGGHTNRVTRYAEMLGRKLNVSASDFRWIRLGTPLHDIGKIGIDDSILKKPGPLTPAEFKIMQAHTVKGAMFLANLPDLAPMIPIVRSHHERWDGKGYPDGLAGEAIPRLARIVAVADTFDAMTSDRPYRKGMAADVAFAEVEKQSGKQFDPECAAAFLAIRDDIGPVMELTASKVTGPTENLKPVLANA
ncbi:MAG TPA: HD domain-containing phosphohydrolase [Gemmataceae bacterium]|nr:HD domain-containing phosphohydrolase [Gemmataceae bacterium]